MASNVSGGGVHKHGSVVAAYSAFTPSASLFFQIALHVDIDRHHDILAVVDRRLVDFGAALNRNA